MTPLSAATCPFELLDLGPLGGLGEGGGRLVAEGRVVEPSALGVEGLGEGLDAGPDLESLGFS